MTVTDTRPARWSTADLDRAVQEVDAVTALHAADCDRDARFPEEALAALRSTGLLGLMVPAEYGGAGGGLADMAAVSSRLSRTCMSVGMIFTMHCQQVAAVVRDGGPLRDRLLPRVARGELYLASVTTEASTGGHLLSSGASLTGDASTLHVDRFAPVVTGGSFADGFLLTMQAPDATSPTQVSLVYADRDQLRVTVRGGWNPMGMRATHSAPLHLAGDVPAGQVVGVHGGFRDIAVRTFAPMAHIGWAACWLGTADGALSRTVTLLRAERRSRGLDSELLLRRLSRVRQRLDTVHALINHSVSVLEKTIDSTSASVQLLINAVKLTASEMCPAAVDELVDLLGMRHGYLRDSDLALERALRDLRSAPLNYSNDRLHAADGALVLMDREVRHV
ncbi:acyl-CoA dehydrogenase family protein [Streptomyces candidus]|uniref:Acyl-CoA dehydrogenase n=1 Tax=Streptomyces candidus TaxID=67283 RepID=A0A7X0LRY0_9ACTN|nr:acyl-CoA dehydrogenase family protein [Streptomyces candidus]MBB6438630.1 acyl-CoA dehydrogenase [Streptomyces candidus]GHH45253.1 acyl-CoA dehydrogenase [Streptomyces candidus]